MTTGLAAPTRGSLRLSDGATIAYEIHGREHSGTPIILIRPLGGSMALWGPFRERLAERARIVSFDLRGTGASSPDRAWVTTRQLALDTVGVLDHLGVPRAHVFGISLGGMTATWVGILAPSRVEKLCIAAAPARGFALTHTSVRRQLALAACFFRRRADVEASLVDHILSRRFRREHPTAVRSIERPLHEAPASRGALLKHALAGFLHDARAGLAHIEAPTLVLVGEDDALLGTDPPRALAAAIPNATFDIIAESGHDLTLEQPWATATRVSAFFLG